MSSWQNILRDKASDYAFASVAQGPDGVEHTPIQKNSGYISVLLRSTRIVDIRKGWSKFYPLIHSYISIPHLDGQIAEFQVVTSPSKLAELDSNRLDRVISLNHRLLGPTPYRGGDLKLEIGLFSVKSSDLAKPFLGVLEDMASAAGVSFVSVAMPFIGPLKKGVELLMGSSELSLEIGLATIFNKPETGYFAAMRAPREEVSATEFKIAEDFRLTQGSNQAVRDYPYFVFSIDISERRDDWFLIPDIASLYKELMGAVRKDKRGEANEVFSVFRRTVLTSPDLLQNDARKLVREVEDKVAEALPTVMTSTSTHEIPPLREIRLFR